MELATALVGVAAILLLYSMVKKYRRSSNLPPTPGLIPFLLTFFIQPIFYGVPPHKVFHSFAQKYGAVFIVDLLVLDIVVIHGAEVIQEAFHNKRICDRPPIKILKNVLDGSGIAFSSGEAWKIQRRIAMTFMKKFGLNKTEFEDRVAVEADNLMAVVNEHGGRPFDPYILLSNAVSNLICQAIYGKRFEYADPQFQRLLRAVYRNIQLIGGVTGALQVMPGAQLFAQFLPPVKETGDNFKLLYDFTRTMAEEHRSNFDPEHPRDFIDLYLVEMQGSANRKSKVSMNDLCAAVGDLFMAGTETTATTVRWGMLYMMAYPEIQQKIQDELDSVVGRDRFPNMADRPRLPYTEATMLEIFRLGNVVPLGAPHQASVDTSIGEYHIPKGSFVFANLGMIGFDDKAFPEPNAFKPKRFLDEAGQLIQQKNDLIPFSTGPRMCIGETMSRTELFIFFTRLLHQFTLSKPAQAPPISFQGIAGITFSPLPFEVCAVPRQ